MRTDDNISNTNQYNSCLKDLTSIRYFTYFTSLEKYIAFYLSKTNEINREIVQQEELHYHPKEVNFPHYINLLDVGNIYL